MLLMSAVFLAVDFCINKIYQRKKGTSPAAGFGFNALLGLFTAIIFLAANGFKLNITPFSVLMAAAMGCAVMGYNLVGFRLLKRGTMAMYTLFLMTGGMIIPYMYGLIFLGEPFSLVQMAALLLIFCGVVFSNVSKEKADSRQIFMCALVFVLNGASSVISKVHQIEATFEIVDATEFVILTGFAKFLIAGVLYFVYSRREPKGQKGVLSTVGLVFSSAVVSGLAYLLLLLGAAALPATVMYPFISGGSIAFSSAAGVIFFGDKLSKKLVLSALLCIVGMIIFVL